jgi:hypothetical protein
LAPSSPRPTGDAQPGWISVEWQVSGVAGVVTKLFCHLRNRLVMLREEQWYDDVGIRVLQLSSQAAFYHLIKNHWTISPGLDDGFQHCS